jgi:hypothetical protein
MKKVSISLGKNKMDVIQESTERNFEASDMDDSTRGTSPNKK